MFGDQLVFFATNEFGSLIGCETQLLKKIVICELEGWLIKITLAV
jgi:hypothetical protein